MDPIQIIIPVALAITMFGMGLGLPASAFSRLLEAPKPVIVGLGAQTIGLPLVGFLTAAALGLEGPLALGLVLIATCPGGPTSNLLTAFAKGDLALAITLSAFNGVLAVVALPFVINFAGSLYMPGVADVRLPILSSMGQILAVTLLPTAIGMRVLYTRPALAARMEPIFRRFALVFLMILIVGTFVTERTRVLQYIADVGVAVVTMQVLSMAMAWLVARMSRLNRPQSVAITIEVGMQNAVMAMGIALAMLQRADVAVPAIVYAGLMYFTSGAVVLLALRAGRKDEAAKGDAVRAERAVLVDA